MVKKMFLAAILAAALGASVPASAFEAADFYEILGVAEPRILPDSPLYFLKNVGRGLRMFFVFDEAKKAELELKFADEKIAEMKKLSELRPEAEEAREKAMENYLESAQRLGKRLESLRGKNKNVEPLLDKMAERAIAHRKLFADLGEEIKEADVKKAAEEIAEGVKKAFALDEEKFREKLKEKLLEEEGDEFLEDFGFLDEWKDADEELAEEIFGLEKELAEEMFEDFENKEEKAREQIKRAEKAVEALGFAINEPGIPSAAKESACPSEQSIACERPQTPFCKNGKWTCVGPAGSSGIAVGTDEVYLLDKAKGFLDSARKAYKEGKYGEAYGQAKSAEEHAQKGLRIIGKLKIIPDADKEERLKKCGIAPLAPVPADCKGWVCEDGGWKLMCPQIRQACPEIAPYGPDKESCLKSAKTLEEKYPGCRYANACENAGEFPFEPKPPATVCAFEYKPVCGTDGKTYANACRAKVAKIEIKYEGECGKSSCPPPPPCDGLLIKGETPESVLGQTYPSCPRYECVPKTSPAPY